MRKILAVVLADRAGSAADHADPDNGDDAAAKNAQKARAAWMPWCRQWAARPG